MNGADITIVDSCDIPEVITALQSVRDQCLSRNEINDAQRADEPAQELDIRLQAIMKSQARDHIDDRYQRRLARAKKALQDLQDSVDRTLSNLKSSHALDVTKLKAKQQVEMEDFLARYRNEQGIKRWNRASVHLQDLRKKRSVLVTQREYDKIRLNDDEQEEVMQLERNEAYRQMAMQREAGLKLMKDRHASELKTLEVANAGREGVFLAAAKLDIERAEKRVIGLEHLLSGVADDQKVWNLHHRFARKPFVPDLNRWKFRSSILSRTPSSEIQLPPLEDLDSGSERGPRVRAQTPLNRVPPV
jgi:hypothetical protein